MNFLPLKFLILVFSFACSQTTSEDYLAKIGSEYILFSDFFKWIPKHVFQALPDSSKNEQINRYFTYQLVYKEITSSNMDKEEGLSKKTKDFSKEALSQLLIQNEIINRIYSDDSLRNLYNDLRYKRKIKSILIRFGENKGKHSRTKTAAEKLIWQLFKKSREMEFDDLAMRYTEDLNMAQKKGSFGWITKYNFDNVMDSIVWATDVGQVSQPFLSSTGYRILKVEDEKKSDLSSFEQELPTLKRMAFEIWDFKLQDNLDAYLNNLKRDAGYIIHKDQIQEFCNEYKKQTNEREGSPNLIIKEITARFKFGSYNEITLDNQWLLNNIPNKNHIGHYIFSNPIHFLSLIEKNVEVNLLYKQALDLGIDSSVEFLMQLSKYKLKTYYNYYMSRVAYKKATVSEEELKVYYEENKHTKYMTGKKVRANILEFPTEQLANNTYIKLKAGDDFNKHILKYGANISDNPKGHLRAFSKDEFGILSKTAFELEIQTFSKPIKFQNKYYILKVVEVLQPVPKFFNEVKNTIKTKLVSEKKSYLEKVQIEKLKDKYDASIFKEF